MHGFLACLLTAQYVVLHPHIPKMFKQSEMMRQRGWLMVDLSHHGIYLLNII